MHFWSLDSASSVGALSELETTYQMYRQRDFDFVSVCTNAPDETEKALAALRQQHATTRNLILSAGDSSGRKIAFGSITQLRPPYTVLLSPEGKLVFEKEGRLDILNLRRTILANMPADYIGFQQYWAAE